MKKIIKIKLTLLLFLMPMVINNKMFSNQLPNAYIAHRDIVVETLEIEMNKILKGNYFKFSRIDIDHLYFMELNRIKYNIPKHIFYRLIYQESRYKKNAKSPAGAIGYMQVMPATFKWINSRTSLLLTDITNPYDNIRAGSYLLRYLKDRIDNDYLKISESYKWKLVLASYNAGYSRKFTALKKYKETMNYVAFICKST